MHLMVLGGGLAGVTSAWYLRKAGFDVTIVDRQPDVALETSFANGGQISVSHPEPWANPGAPLTILRWFGREDAPLLFRASKDPAQWRWGAAFLAECLPWRARRNTEAIAALATYSRDCLRNLRVESGIEYPHRKTGILHLFSTHQALARLAARADELAKLGISTEVCNAERCMELEPALVHGGRDFLGGLFAADDESGDAHLFTRALADKARQAGVKFILGANIKRIREIEGRIESIDVEHADGWCQQLEANAYVLCLGSFSPLLLPPTAERLPIYPVKGYSITVPISDPSRAPSTSITDEARRIVFSRLGEHLRVAGTAELSGFSTAPNPARSHALIDWLERHFPGVGAIDEVSHWSGLRPATPSNLPIIGRSRLLNLWFNTGHGTLGWTLACGSAASLAALMSGNAPKPRFPYFGRDTLTR